MNNQNITLKQSAKGQSLGLYIHIPFCIKKCDYCDFLSAPANEDRIQDYFNGMLAEIEQYQGKTGEYIVDTIFIGGGTPSYVDSIYIEKIMKAVRKVFVLDNEDLEVTIEINPGTVTREKLEAYKRNGINRLSFGLQSVNNEELSLLGRVHTYEEFEENYYLARDLGFNNINIDLMSALPGQTLKSWENTLNKVIGLKPEHISAYSLIIEEGTKFYERYREGAEQYFLLPGEETDRLMYHRTKEILCDNGYRRYEISNYARDRFQCKHNIRYWIGSDYLGMGVGAASLLDRARFLNLHDVARYISRCNEYQILHDNKTNSDKCFLLSPGKMENFIDIRMDFEKLSSKQQMEEFMFLGLRISDGISKRAFFHKFQKEVDDIYGDILRKLEGNNLLEIGEDNIRLTDYGMDVSNYVFSQLLLD